MRQNLSTIAATRESGSVMLANFKVFTQFTMLLVGGEVPNYSVLLHNENDKEQLEHQAASEQQLRARFKKLKHTPLSTVNLN